MTTWTPGLPAMADRPGYRRPDSQNRKATGPSGSSTPQGNARALLRSVWRRAGSGEPAAAPEVDELTSGDLRLNLTARRAYVDTNEIKLSNKEFDLLTELMRNQSAVLSRDLILTKVWGYDSFVDKRTVDVHIRWLREKIEEDPSSPKRIITVRGVGYRFEG